MRGMKSLFGSLIMYGSIMGLCSWGCLEEERSALLQIKDSINSPEGSAFSSWYGEDCCRWEDVECDPSTSTVVKLFIYRRRDANLADKWHPNATMFSQLKNLQELHLPGNQIGGFASPNAIHELKHLQKFDLRRNYIEEGSQLCWGKMPSLHILYLSGNKLQGPIPKCLCHQMHSLMNLDISYNQLHGDIEACFSNMSFLQHLDISGNDFNGAFPSLLLQNMTNIETFIASHNQFSGRISFSTTFANLSKLKHLDLSYNDKHLEIETESPTNWFPSFSLNGLFLAGCNLNKHSGNKIPSFISIQNHLMYLDLSYNSLMGSIPHWLLYSNNTSALWLKGNKLSGLFPEPTGNNNSASRLALLDMSDNLFHGSLPSNLNILLPKLYHFNASWNQFQGGIPAEMMQLRNLDLSNNQLQGEIFTSMTTENRSTSILEYLDLSNNYNLRGKILPRNSSFPKLKLLYLHGNNLAEMEFDSLSTCSSLQILDVGENNLLGELSPLQLPLLTMLRVISLRKNHLEGHIPEQLCQMKDLHVLDIAENNLSGTIPLCLNNISSWVQQEDFMYSRSTTLEDYPVPHLRFVIKGMEITFSRILTIFTLMDVSSNRIEGTIPFQLGDLKNIRILNVSNNFLTGHIPTTLGSLKELESLDLSHNKLFGQIPQELTGMPFLEVFDVSFNNLSGHIPRGHQFDTFGNDSYIGNRRLCGSPLSKEYCSYNLPSPPPVAAAISAAVHTTVYNFIFWCIVLHIITCN